MNKWDKIIKTLLLEQDSKLTLLRKAISERLPITINYSGPSGEVKSGQRIDIEPIVMGKHKTSGNLVIWAYVFKGVSKRGLPGWKMFRVDRITSAKQILGQQSFKLGSLPGYQKGKAPSAMKSLSSVEIFSPYWFEDDKRFTPSPTPFPKPKTEKIPTKAPEVTKPEQPEIDKKEEPRTDLPIQKPEMIKQELLNKVYDELKPKIQDINGEKTINRNDYQKSLDDLYRKKEESWKNYQRQLSGNIRPGEGTRNKFKKESQIELDDLLKKDNIKVNDDNMLSESFRIKTRIKHLIFY